jgi:hypothetical protein
MDTLTIDIPNSLRKDLEELSRQRHQPMSRIVRDMLERQLTFQKLEAMRREARPYAEALGLYTDEDIFKALA